MKPRLKAAHKFSSTLDGKFDMSGTRDSTTAEISIVLARGKEKLSH